MTVDAHESARGYPVPDEANKVAAEFPRLRLAIQAVAADVAGILTALATKSAVGHTHAIADVSGLSDALGAKMAASKTFALADLTDVNIAAAPTGRQVLLYAANKWVPGSVDWSDITNKPAAGFTGAQVVTALGYTPADAAKAITSTARNRHLNPAFQVCQDRAAGATVAITGYAYAFDGVAVFAGGGGALTCSQAIKSTPGGSPYRFRAAVTTADTAITAGDLYVLNFMVEGVDVADLLFGTPAARSFTWRGLVNLPAGTYGLSFRNGAGNRSYVTTFVVSSAQAGTDILVTATVPGDTSGTWISDASGVGIIARICLAASTSNQTGSLGLWQAGDALTTSAQTNSMASTSNVFEVADIGLYSGTELPQWEMPSVEDDLRRCRRYFEMGSASVQVYGPNGWGFVDRIALLSKRSTPSIALGSTSGSGIAISVGTIDRDHFDIIKVYANSGVGAAGLNTTWIANARL